MGQQQLGFPAQQPQLGAMGMMGQPTSTNPFHQMAAPGPNNAFPPTMAAAPQAMGQFPPAQQPAQQVT